MSPKEFADRVANNEKFYDKVTGKIVTIIGAVDISGETYGETDDGELIKVNAKNLESTEQKSSDKRSDTEELSDLLKEMGINPEDVGVGIADNTKSGNKEIADSSEEEKSFLESYTSSFRHFINHYKEIGDKYSKKYDKIRDEEGIEKQENEQMLDAIYEYPTEMLEKIVKAISKDEEFSKTHNGDGIISASSKRLMEQGDIDKALELLENEFIDFEFKVTLKLDYINKILDMRNEQKKEEPKTITPENIEQATEGEVTTPNFGKAITDITNTVKGDEEKGDEDSDIKKSDDDGVTQADDE